MRLTIRVILATTTAVGYALDELTTGLRGTAYGPGIGDVRKLHRTTERALRDILDSMVDDGFGDAK